MDFQTGPCKLNSPLWGYLFIEKDPERKSYFNYRGDAATIVPHKEIKRADDNPQKCWQARTGDHIFTAFNLIPDGTGRAWQLLLVIVPAPGMPPESISNVKRADLVLGMLPNESGRAGLVARLTKEGEPTPGSQVLLRRDGCTPYANVVIENNTGQLYMDPSKCTFFWGKTNNRMAPIFQFHKILSMIDMTPVDPLKFVRNPADPQLLMLPPLDVTAEDFEHEHLSPPTAQQHPPPMPRNEDSQSPLPENTSTQQKPTVSRPPEKKKPTAPIDGVFVLMLLALALLGMVVGAAVLGKGNEGGDEWEE